MTARMTVDVKVIDTLRAERNALRREVLKYQKEAHDSKVTIITAIQLLREVWSDYGKRADISAAHLEEIENFLRSLPAGAGGKARGATGYFPLATWSSSS